MASNVVAPRILEPISWTRKLSNNLLTLFAVGSSILVIVPLFAIFAYLVMKGVGSINWAFLTQTPKPVGEPGGGMGNAIVGSGLILALASLIGIPLGIGAGIYLSEYGRNWLANAVRFTADVLNGVPSIVVGISVYWLVVITQKHFSAVAGGVALGIMMIPTVSRATEEMLLMVPRTIREAAWGLGVSQWRATLSMTLRTASAGVITGVMLAFARAAGETAPLLVHGIWKSVLELQYQSADRGAAHSDFRLRDFAIRRVAQAGVGGCAGPDPADCSGGDGGASCDQPRHDEGSIIGDGCRDRSPKPESLVRKQRSAAQREHVDRCEPRDSTDWAFGLRQVDVRALPESHARDDPGDEGRWHGA